MQQSTLLLAEESTIYSIFLASVRSIGTAVTLASVGVYLHRRGFVGAEGKRTLALISRQVTFPLFLFTKIIQDWSNSNVVMQTTLNDAWLLFLWPLFVVCAGLFVGTLVTHVARTPRKQRRAVWAACAFGNSTGLPITLLTAVHANFPQTSDLGRVDPTLFLSVYLLLYPILQWGIGGWLLTPPTEQPQDGDEIDTTKDVANDAKGIMPQNDPHRHSIGPNSSDGVGRPHITASVLPQKMNGEHQALLLDVEHQALSSANSASSTLDNAPHNNNNVGASVRETIESAARRCLQPPVIGALCGIVCAIIEPLRDIFVEDMQSHYSSTSAPPLQWLFDGLCRVGLAAVPINMMILGCNLSASQQQQQQQKHRHKTMHDKKTSSSFLPWPSVIGIVIGKMLILPFIGITSTFILREYNCLTIPDGAFYLVLMIVFLTPTANNVMVMVELSDSSSDAKEGIARVIALQYTLAPLILSLTMTTAIGLASSWS